MTRRCLASIAILVLVAANTAAQEDVPVSRLHEFTHIHGLAVDRADPSRLLIGTPHGFFVADANGRATRISGERDDFMGFTPHPAVPATLYASGHPETGGNPGVIKSIIDSRSQSA